MKKKTDGVISLVACMVCKLNPNSRLQFKIIADIPINRFATRSNYIPIGIANMRPSKPEVYFFRDGVLKEKVVPNPNPIVSGERER